MAIAGVLGPTTANAVEPDVVPDMSSVPVEPSTYPEGEVISSSVCRRSAMLAVHSARIRGGRLAISGRLARGITGEVRGVARYRGGKLHFVASVEDTGRISIHERLPGGKVAQAARVTLVYPGSGCFEKQRVTLKAVRHATRTRIRGASPARAL